MTVAAAGDRRRRWYAGRLILFGTCVACLLTFFIAPPAPAHAELLSTSPTDGAVLTEPPADVELRFSEPVQLVDGGLRLLPDDEPPLALDPRVNGSKVITSLPTTLDNGQYTLSYRAISAEGHPVAGAVTFTVGTTQGSAPTPPGAIGTPGATQFAMSAVTGLQYVGLLFFAGLVFFDSIVLRSRQPVTGRTRTGLLAAGAVGLAATLVLIPVSAMNVLAEPLRTIMTPSVWLPGVMWPPVAVSVVVLAGIGLSLMASIRPVRHAGSRIVSAIAAVATVASPVLVGHSRLIEPTALMVAADLAHLLTGALWTGGVLGLLLFLISPRPAAPGAHGRIGPSAVARVVARFSCVALWSVMLLAISGLTMSMLIASSIEAPDTSGYRPTLLLTLGAFVIASIESLMASQYGFILLLKVGIIAPVIAIAAWNRWQLLPALLTKPTSRSQWRTLHRTLLCEAVLLIAVLVVTGFLTNLSPAHENETSSTDTAGQDLDSRFTLNGKAQGPAGTWHPVPGEDGQ